MLSLGGHATTSEQWGNSFATQLIGVVDTMSQSLRIKEDSYNNMFTNKEKAISYAKLTLEKVQRLHDEALVIKAKYSDASAKLLTADGTIHKLDTDVKLLQEKLAVSNEKLDKEREANTNLYSTVRMTQHALS